MWFHDHPSIRHRQITYTVCSQNSAKLRKMCQLGPDITHMLNDMVRKHHIKGAFSKWKPRTCYLLVCVTFGHQPIVLNVNSFHAKLQIRMSPEVMCNASGACADLKQSQRLPTAA
ncbi:hypothetical protein GCM10011408_12100 [Dyella caseinilytica]|nr:hypothetical protein GCM10011408_12100 [Dyella caseinilytica]